jgi:hypothetical protein
MSIRKFMNIINEDVAVQNPVTSEVFESVQLKEFEGMDFQQIWETILAECPAESQNKLNEWFGPFKKKTQAELYPDNEFAAYNQNDRGKEGFNFNKKKPDIEAHPLFDKLVDMCDEDSGYSLRQQCDVAAEIAKDLGYSIFQVQDYGSRGPWKWRFGVGNDFTNPDR